MTTAEKWSKDYTKQLRTPPEPGTILRAFGAESVARLDLDLAIGRPPFLYARAYVPSVVGQDLGWYLQDYESKDSRGWKVIILPKSREEFLKWAGDRVRTRLPVKSLRVVKLSQSGNSMLAEIHEYADFPETPVEEEVEDESAVAVATED